MEDGTVDLSSGDYAQLLRAPDLRLIDLSWDRLDINRPFLLDFPETRRACFYFVRRGAAFFRTGSGEDELHYVTQGTSVGVEGHPHQWLDRSHLHRSDINRATRGRPGQTDMPLELVMSSIDRSAAVLQRLPHGAIVVPDTASPFAAIIRGCVDLITIDQESGMPDPGVSRRLAEVIMLQLVAFARSRLWHGPMPTRGVLHDEFLLRAMTAFFADPGAPWTVASLARAAGLSRAAFAERFRKAFDEPALRTINRMRLQQAAEMLLRSNAALGEIAGEVGFGSAAAFVRAFARHFGKTPGQWRKQGRHIGGGAPEQKGGA